MAEISNSGSNKITDESTRAATESVASSSNQDGNTELHLCLDEEDVKHATHFTFSPVAQAAAKKRKKPLKRWRLIKLPIKCEQCEQVCERALNKRWHGKKDDLYLFDYEDEYRLWYFVTALEKWYCGVCYESLAAG